MKLTENLKGLSVICGAIFAAKKYKKTIADARRSGDLESERAQIHEAVSFWAGRVFDYFEVDVNVINAENLPDQGPVVYVSNHQSYADIPLYFHTIKNHQVSFIAKDTLEKAPLFGYWIRNSRGLFLRRGDARASLATINEGAELLKQGFSLVIFPEGTRSHCSEMSDFKPGSLKLATKAKVPIVPVTINGTYRMYEETGIMTKGVHIDFVVHEPIDTAGLSRSELAELPERVETAIRTGLSQLIK
ncbi:MAG: 1-acyl-sn-glycerol-3-phosphate acyltransferase [Firmicutes bacterium]|nr:1-acyl-sn-glycerol-3-phosphate acyltransferase [Bacillota bacterium]